MGESSVCSPKNKSWLRSSFNPSPAGSRMGTDFKLQIPARKIAAEWLLPKAHQSHTARRMSRHLPVGRYIRQSIHRRGHDAGTGGYYERNALRHYAGHSDIESDNTLYDHQPFSGCDDYR